MPQSARMGGGGGLAGLRTTKYSFMSFHLTHGDIDETSRQIAVLMELAEEEKALGQIPILMGDFNLDESSLTVYGMVNNGKMISVPTDNTCPTILASIIGRKIDHVVVPIDTLCKAMTVPYGSDHKAVIVEIEQT